MRWFTLHRDAREERRDSRIGRFVQRPGIISLNEMRMLFRDPGAMVILFVMPVVLVFVVSLIQGNVFKFMEMGSEITVLLVDEDEGSVSNRIIDSLKEVSSYRFQRTLGDQRVSAGDARELIDQGRFRCAVIFPKNFSRSVLERADADAEASLKGRSSSSRSKEKAEAEDTDEMIADPRSEDSVQVLFDPALGSPFRSAFVAMVNLAVMQTEIEIRSAAIQALLPRLDLRWTEERLVTLGGDQAALDAEATPSPGRTHEYRRTGEKGISSSAPTTAQQNVPAWTLFGMFFIVLPISGVFIRERDFGTLDRIRTCRISLGQLIGGKFCAYFVVCILQFVCMMIVGLYLLPFATAEPLRIPNQYGAIVLLAVACAGAAVGFGLLLASLAKSYEQASTLGAISVVIAAAIGGLMVPGYLMPESLHFLKNLSPLGWGHAGFLQIFIRNGNVARILPNAVGLTLFCLGTCGLSIYIMHRRERRR